MTTDGWQADADDAARAALGAWAVMCTNSPGGWSSDHEGLLQASSGIPFAPLNGVWSATPDVATADVLKAVDEFAAGDLPWNLQLRPGHPAELDGKLADRGLVVTGDIPFMARNGPAAPDGPRDVPDAADVPGRHLDRHRRPGCVDRARLHA